MSPTLLSDPATEKQIATAALTGISSVLSAPSGSEPVWAKPAVSILSLLVFVALIFVAYLRGDTVSLGILSGVGASMAQQVAGYYLGSSSGSAAKTALLASAPPAAPAIAAPVLPAA